MAVSVTGPTAKQMKYSYVYSLLNLIMSTRQTAIYFIDRNKSYYRLICHSNKRDICTWIYKNVSLLKSYDNIHGMTNN